MLCVCVKYTCIWCSLLFCVLVLAYDSFVCLCFFVCLVCFVLLRGVVCVVVDVLVVVDYSCGIIVWLRCVCLLFV